MKKYLFLFVFLFLVSFAMAQPPFQTNVNSLEGLQIFYPQLERVPQNASFNLHIHVANISNGFPFLNTEADCRLHLYDNTGNHTFESEVMGKDSNGYDHEIFISSGNFSKLGEHAFYIWCNNSVLGGEARGTFDVTTTGLKLSIEDSLVRIFLLIFFVALFAGLYHVVGGIDFKKWNDRIIEKYKSKNFVKMVLSILAYNILKNVFIIYYLIGLPIFLILKDITYTYNISGLILFMDVLLMVYIIGVLIVGIVFISYVQEWASDMLELVREMDWGVESNGK